MTHSECNQNKGASDLRVARSMAVFRKLQKQAVADGKRGADLGLVLDKYGGAKFAIRLQESSGQIKFTLSDVGDHTIQHVPLYRDSQSGMSYFFSVFPLEYIHHDGYINPRSIGATSAG